MLLQVSRATCSRHTRRRTWRLTSPAWLILLWLVASLLVVWSCHCVVLVSWAGLITFACRQQMQMGLALVTMTPHLVWGRFTSFRANALPILHFHLKFRTVQKSPPKVRYLTHLDIQRKQILSKFLSMTPSVQTRLWKDLVPLIDES